MNKQKWTVLLAALLLIGGASAVLARFKAGQKLGQPGVKTAPIEGSRNLRVELPESLTGYKSELVETAPIVINTLPKDTSFGQRRYQAEDGFQILVNVVLMGTDRTSLHKPQFCLVGSGWTIDQTEMTTVPIERPHPYELPVIKLTNTRQFETEGRRVTARGIYVYWFVAGGDVSGDPSGLKRMWSLAKHLVRTGELQRWAYVTYFAICRPGEEDAAYKRMKEFIAASVPGFQLVTPPVVAAQVSSVAAGK